MKLTWHFWAFGWLCCAPLLNAQRVVEELNRGIVAVPLREGGNIVLWRSLVSDPPDLRFNLYRSPEGGKSELLNGEPLRGATCFVDAHVQPGSAVRYEVRAVKKSGEDPAGGSFTVKAGAPAGYIPIPLQTPKGYSPNDASVGDLDGDGEFEIVLHQAGRGHDNSHEGATDAPILQAYKLNGTKLWGINLGNNVREGPHYTQFLVYDFDGDGKAEVACKTADGTRDGKGKVIGDPNANWVNKDGRILSGPEYLTVFNGQTGAEMATVRYIPARHPGTDNPTEEQMREVWGDGYGNRMDRFLAGVAYLDGKLPSLVMARGYYNRTVLAAWDWRNGKLACRWVFDTASSPENGKFGGQGNHNLTVADVDGDGKDEIIYGGMAVDDDGKGLYSTGLGHGDALHVGDLDPTRPGLEVFRIQENFGDAGAHMFDARTGQVLWRKPSVSKGKDGEGPGRGLSLDIDPRFPGAESWVQGAGISGLFDAKGNVISEEKPSSCNFGIWWDGDLLREILDKNKICKWNWSSSTLDPILVAKDCVSNNGSKATPCLSADILGDWREEVIWRTKDNSELRIYVTPEPTQYRLPTLLQDPQYRLSIAWQNVGYNQPPHTSFYLGEGMRLPTQSDERPELLSETRKP
jgi:rhamnogalacturonan endolyase